MLAKAGFHVVATDISLKGVELSKEWLENQNLSAGLIVSSCYDCFAFADSVFVCVIANQVIHHSYIEKIRFSISEIERILRPKGIVYVTVRARKKESIPDFCCHQKAE